MLLDNQVTRTTKEEAQQVLRRVVKGEELCGVIKDHKSVQNSGETAVLLFHHLEILWD